MPGQIARGLGDVKLGVLGAADAAPNPVDLVDAPGARTLDFQATADTDSFEGDNTIIAVAQGNKTGTGSFAMGKLSLAALALCLGGTVVTTGTTPSVITKWEEPSTPSSIYVTIIGQTNSFDSSGSGYRVTLHKANFSSPAESLGQSAWNEPTMDFQYIATSDDRFVTREQYETLVDIPTA